ncbi:hypothetical protein MKW98_007658 [Papaver atlanticum]|uniref:tRNA(His) guanylyltransferase n=1 Tax=Papaver atlanticum TaxID=357466 RepID=A0AAD4S364_9MAGN|nr:hypothetical protein MKW98_007658 [Papaver atlanticum]
MVTNHEKQTSRDQDHIQEHFSKLVYVSTSTRDFVTISFIGSVSFGQEKKKNGILHFVVSVKDFEGEGAFGLVWGLRLTILKKKKKKLACTPPVGDKKTAVISTKAMFEEFPALVFSYGVSDEYSFVFKKTTEFYNRRSSKIVSITVSFFTSVYVMKWKDFFPDKDLKSIPSFDARTVCYPSTKIVRDYLAWRQVDCHINNQYNTCFWKLIESGKTKSVAQDRLKGTQTQDKNEIIFQLGVNYSNLPAIFRKGSCVFKDTVEEIVKYNENGQPVKRSRNKVITDHCDIIGDEFWKEHASILKDE